MSELQKVVDRLGGFYDAAEAMVWLVSPHPQLNGRRPVDVIRNGHPERVHAIIDRLDSSVYR